MRRRKRPRIVIFTVLTTITLLTWVVADLVRVFTRSTPVQVEPKILEELNPNIDNEALTQIKPRLFFSNEEALSIGKTQATESAQIEEGSQ